MSSNIRLLKRKGKIFREKDAQEVNAIREESQRLIDACDLFKKKDQSSQTISMEMLVRRSLSNKTAEGEQGGIDATNVPGEDDLGLRLSRVTHVRLDRERIEKISNLEFTNSVTNLYLQHNRISRIENLNSLIYLRFLVLSNNCISKVENLKVLSSLMLLDLSGNRIESINPNEFPKSIVIIDLEDNPAPQNGYRIPLIANLPKLRQIDNLTITEEEREEVYQAWEYSSEEEEEGEKKEEEKKEEEKARKCQEGVNQRRSRGEERSGVRSAKKEKREKKDMEHENDSFDKEHVLALRESLRSRGSGRMVAGLTEQQREVVLGAVASMKLFEVERIEDEQREEGKEKGGDEQLKAEEEIKTKKQAEVNTKDKRKEPKLKSYVSVAASPTSGGE
eukprot:Nk52_evm8s2635 gene=Nk52_evmTU8s2635